MFEMCPPTSPESAPTSPPTGPPASRRLAPRPPTAPSAPVSTPTFLLVFLQIAPDSKHSKSQRHARKHWPKRDFTRSWRPKRVAGARKHPIFKPEMRQLRFGRTGQNGYFARPARTVISVKAASPQGLVGQARRVRSFASINREPRPGKCVVMSEELDMILCVRHRYDQHYENDFSYILNFYRLYGLSYGPKIVARSRRTLLFSTCSPKRYVKTSSDSYRRQ